jgi:hypothetical protein
VGTRQELKDQPRVYLFLPKDWKGYDKKDKKLLEKLWTQEPENFDEEVKSLGTAWC